MNYVHAWSSRQLHKDNLAVSSLHMPADPHLDSVTTVPLALPAPFSLAAFTPIYTYGYPCLKQQVIA